ncbi:uncharacterized protein BX663DRAFT_502931 [Cokeromyces recurvatus]|uniref:uncharacterized protein n=1 Tax=Cokeromyces recurvatus TaxID=90255 RepID=UPI00221FADDF|nr:uncharacterized protein BX663DRAFT_502931 [Cokeromyces recurvatus]KAI7904604.1 hypothetical protein BX663DRAFT_502931 [Cokeromyces recurvatus]
MLINTLIKLSALFFSSLFIVEAQIVTNLGSCSAYPPNAICSDYIDYSAFISNNASITTVEAELARPLNGLGELVKDISPVCFDAFARYECSKAYPKCVADNNSTKTIHIKVACSSACKDVQVACTNILEMAGYLQLLPNCFNETITSLNRHLQTDDACNKIPTKLTDNEIKNGKLNISAISNDFIIAKCPSPFLPDPLALSGTTNTLDTKYCRHGCCIPCPAQNYFYKENASERAFLATDIIRFISAILSLVLVISYCVLPDKRRHPSLLILNLSIAIFFFNMSVFFSIANPKRLQCAANGISPGEIGSNSLCAAQGAILIFGSFATILWCAALILNLHVHTVWNSNIFANKYIFLNIICWGIPATIMVIAIALHAIKFEFANLCLVSMNYIFPLFFYPLAAIVCPSFLVHIATFFYIARIAVREGLESDMTQSLSTGSITDQRAMPTVSRRHVFVAVKIQWRALLLAVIAIVTVLFYWLFYMTQMNRMTDLQSNPALTSEWLECMLIPGNTQNMCADLIRTHLPPFPLIVIAETLVSTIGIWLFIMFGKRSLWREWNDLIYDIRISLSRRGRAEKSGEQFFAL